MTGHRVFRMIAGNDAMTAEPREAYGRPLMWLVLVVWLGGVAYGMHNSLFSVAVRSYAFQMRAGLLDSTLSESVEFFANISTTFQMAAFAGALLSIAIVNRLGRRLSIFIAMAVMLVGDIVQCASTAHLVAIYIGRSITGVGVGGLACAVPIFAAEHSPRATRGLVLSTYVFGDILGNWIGFWTNYGVAMHITLVSDAVWIVPLAVQILPLLILSLSLYPMTDTPRSLALRGDGAGAQSALARARGLDPQDAHVQSELKDMDAQLHRRSRFTTPLGQAIKDPSNRRRLLIAVVLMVAQNLAGSYSILRSSQITLLSAGFSRYTTTMIINVLPQGLQHIGIIVFMLLVVERVGRRRALLWTLPMLAACLFAVGIFTAVLNTVGWRVGLALYWAELSFGLLYACVWRFSLGAIPIIYATEIPTTRLRGLTVGVAVAVHWLFTMAMSRAVPYMMYYIGPGGFGAHLIFGACCLATFAFVWYFVPETKGRSLEAMDELFAKQNAPNDESGSDDSILSSEAELADKD